MGTSDAISYTDTFDKPFWEDPKEWMDRSSIFYEGSGKTPTVLIHYQNEWHGTTSQPPNFLRTHGSVRTSST